jgi:hypothetical protein
MEPTHNKPRRMIFLFAGIFLIFMATLSSVYSYYYFKDQINGLGSDQNIQLAHGWPVIIVETIMICTVLGLLGGLFIGMYVAWRAKKGQKST